MVNNKLLQALTTALRFQQAHDLNNAEAWYLKALKINPVNFDALHMLGVVFAEQKQFERAEVFIRRAIAVKNGSARAHTNLGNALRGLGRLEEALCSHESAIKIQPDLVDAWHNKGNVLAELKRREDAVMAYDQALLINPDSPRVLNDKAAVLLEIPRAQEAMICCRRALELMPDYVDACYNLGSAFKFLKEYDSALLAFNEVLKVRPDFAACYWNRGLVLEKMGRIKEAHVDFDASIRLDPSEAFRHASRYHSKMLYCVWDNHSAELNDLLSRLEQGARSGDPFALMATPAHPKHLKTSAEHWYMETCAPFPIPKKWEPGKRVPGKLRVGYFSSDFYLHAVSILTAEFFERHDRNGFDVFAFSIAPPLMDAMRARMEGAFDQFFDVGHLSDDEIVEFAWKQNIDIAVDLNGITDKCRPRIFARRVAPVQAGYLGFPGTVSSGLLDYIIADPFVIPEGNEVYFGEKVVRLPHTYMVNDTTRQITGRNCKRSDFGLPEDAFVFCSFNNSYKICPEVFDIWMNLLRKIPGSVFWLPEGKPMVRENLQKEAFLRGIPPERLVFAKHMDLVSDHLGRIPLADLFLDTFNYNAHTTAIDSLWAGLPVLTCPGVSFSSRVAGSILNAIGLPELIANSSAEYEQMALDFALDPDRLRVVRERLSLNRSVFPLFKTDVFSKNFSSALLAMWRRYENGLPPDHIWIVPEGA